ncbi:MAG: hypothetical protein JF599_05600 [Verrucomicrobia bacterium]|nr:hypothetical protein [Verrucomicrobiota bacterium]
MDWILDHFQILIGIAGVVAYWINQLRKNAAARSEESPQRNPLGELAEADERTRRIQEEIRRKIAERRGASAPAAPVQPVRSQAEAPAPVVIVRNDELAAPAYQPEKWMDETVLERQRVLAAQLAALEASRAAAVREAQTVRTPASVVVTAPAGELSLLQELRTARSLRQAIVLREVLGPPVALR